MKKSLLIALLFCASVLYSQTDRKVLLLDLTTINSETNQSRFLSVKYIMENIKVPYDVTTDFNQVALYPVVVATSRIKDGTLNSNQISILADYVNNGGVLITSSLRESSLFPVFGITQSISSNTLFEVNFDVSKDSLLFDYIEDNLEKTISLGRASSGATFFTRQYTPATAEVLGTYENNIAAFVTHSYGQGQTYAFGPDFRDLIYRNLIGLDVNAHRTYSNGFEPTSDVIFLIMRNIIRKHIPYSVYPHYVPSNAKSVVLITHDIDSKSTYDSMAIFADYENQKGFHAQYFATTKYFFDTWPTYYPNVHSAVNNVLNENHKISSHSVGHFSDFSDFEFGLLGNTPANYYPIHTNGTTVGGTILGELELSKNVLKVNPSVQIRSFRAGHLAFPDSLVMGLEMLGYEYNTTNSSNDVLTNYPYIETKIRKFSSEESTILEIPMTISDVFSSDPINSANYQQKVNIWVDVTHKYANNNAPINLLIHPNRAYKLEALRTYINALEYGISEYNFEDYGDFWKARSQMEFTTVYVNNEVKVFINETNIHPDISFLVDVDPGTDVKFYDANNTLLPMLRKNWRPGQDLFHQSVLVGVNDEQGIKSLYDTRIFPNPSQNAFSVNSGKNQMKQAQVFNVSGQLIYEYTEKPSFHFQVNCREWPKGIYFILIKYQDGGETTHKLVVN